MRFIDNQWLIKQRLVKLEVLAKGMNAEELSQRLIQCLAVECMIGPDRLLASTSDGAAVTEAGLRQSKKNLVVSLCETLNEHFRAVDLVLSISYKQGIP